MPPARTAWERTRDLLVHRPRPRPPSNLATLSGLVGCPDTSQPGRQHRTGQVSAVAWSLTGPLEAELQNPGQSAHLKERVRRRRDLGEPQGGSRRVQPLGAHSVQGPGSVPQSPLKPKKMRLFIPNFCLVLELSGSLASRPHVDMGCSQGSVSATPSSRVRCCEHSTPVLSGLRRVMARTTLHGIHPHTRTRSKKSRPQNA